MSLRKFLPDLFCVTLFSFLAGIFFYPTILQKKLPVPSDTLVGLYSPWRDFYSREYPRGIPFKNFLITDPVRQQIPWRKIAIDQWKRGSIPVWNPYNFSGAPLAANIQAGVFYPLNILFFLFDFPVAWTILIILEPLLAGLFLYVYLRKNGIERIACLFGAVAWSFSGFSIAWLTWGTIVHVALWLPIALLSTDMLLSTGPKKTIWLFIFVWSLVSELFAGHIQISLYFLFIVFVYFLWKAYGSFEGKHTFRVVINKTKYIWSGILAFACIGFLQWFPMIQTVLQSGRTAEVSNWLKDGWFLPWQNVVQFISPDFFGNPATLNYWGIWNYGEFTGYIGIAGIFFALYAILLVRSPAVKFWTGVFLVSLLFLLPTPLSKLPFLFSIPLLSVLQPTRLLMIVDFSLVLLSVYGFSSWKKTNKIGFPVIFFLGAVFIVMWCIVLLLPVSAELKNNLTVSRRNLIFPTVLYGIFIFLLVKRYFFSRYRPVKFLVPIGIILFFVIDMFRFGWKFTPFTPESYFYPKTGLIRFLDQQKQPYRIVSDDKEILPPNTTSYYGIETVEGYDPIITRRYEEYMAALGRNKPDINPPFGFNRIITIESFSSPLLPLLNARFVVSKHDHQEKFLKKVFQEGETRLYEDSRAVPRVFFVDGVKVVQQKDAIMAELYNPLFSPYKTAIIEEPVFLLSTPQTPEDTANIIFYRPSHLIIRTASVNSRLLVVSNMWNTHWHAIIDHVNARIYRTNYILQGVVIPAGVHTLELEYTFF